MDKNIKTELAIGLILIIAIIVGGLIWLDSKNIKSDNQIIITQPISQDNKIQIEYPGKNNADFPDDIKDKCQKNNCNGDCLDGWSYTCFYDGNKNKESDFELGFQVEPKNLCFGTRFVSVCGSCINKFELKQGEQLIEASCEEFYQGTKNKNKECGNCLKEITSAS